jgi:DNA-binding transcriptional MerR regulator
MADPTKKDFHKMLQRQVKKYLKDTDYSSEKCQKFLKSVSDSYIHADEDRALIERSLDLSSEELNRKNDQLQQEIRQVKEQTDELQRLNDLMVGRELKMISLKKRIKELEEDLSKSKTPVKEKV